MPVTLTEEQNALATAIGEFARREIPDKAARDRLTADGPHSDEIYRKMADLGWLGIALPEAYGGADGSMTDLLVFLEETAYQQAPIGGFGTTIITAEAIKKFGSEAQKQELLAGVCRGDVLSISMSEPGAGSDVGGLTCKATKTEDGWVINGQKTWCSNAHIASHILLVARTSTEGGKHDGLTMLVVPTDAEGLEIHGIETMGGKEVNDLYFTNCHLPFDAVVGHRGAGLAPAHGRAEPGADDPRGAHARPRAPRVRRHAGLRQGARAVRAAGRQLPGHAPPDRRQRHRARRHEAARARHRAHHRRRAGERCSRRRRPWRSSRPPSSPSISRSRACRCSAGYGYATEYGMERLLRQSVVSTVYGGTSEIQRDIIGKTLGL